jgi:hypothetical protein
VAPSGEVAPSHPALHRAGLPVDRGGSLSP